MTHTKRSNAPSMYPIRRKKRHGTFAPSPRGSHPAERAVPLTIILRDMLGYAENAKEVRTILREGEVLRDGTPENDPEIGIGFMDVLSFPEMDEAYRFLLAEEGAVLQPVDAEEAERKLCKVIGKKTLQGEKTQINLHDGSNVLYEKRCNAGGSVLLTLPDRSVETYFPLAAGATAYLIGGKHRGEVAEVVDIREIQGSDPNIVMLEKDGEEFETIESYVFVIGTDEPEVEL